MPYLPEAQKIALDKSMEPAYPGELTYLLTVLMERYRKINGTSFIVLCTIVGAVVCALLEFYRRVVGPYEDNKIKSNGDVYHV